MKKVPVTIISGFLGGGKTTLINHILAGDHGLKIAIVENELGEEGIDEEVLPDMDDLVVEMNNGCLCCSIKGDMQSIIKSLKEKRGGDFDYLMIEATGIANPINIAEAFVGETPLSRDFELDSILCVIDAFHYKQNLEEMVDDAFLQQIVGANKILLNKTDLIEGTDSIEKSLSGINPNASIVKSVFGKVELEQLLNLNAFSWEEIERELEKESGHHHHHHDIQAVSIVKEGTVNPNIFEAWLNHLMMQNPEIYRTKGVLNLIGMEEKMIFQGVYLRFDFHRGKPWGGDKINRLVIIGKGLNPEVIEREFEKCLMNEEEVALALEKLKKS